MIQEAYLGELKRLATVCRSLAEEELQHQEPVVDLHTLQQRVLDLEAEVEELRDNRQRMTEITELLQQRVAALEKAAPPPHLWQNLIRGISALRDSVPQLQSGQDRDTV